MYRQVKHRPKTTNPKTRVCCKNLTEWDRNWRFLKFLSIEKKKKFGIPQFFSRESIFFSLVSLSRNLWLGLGSHGGTDNFGGGWVAGLRSVSSQFSRSSYFLHCPSQFIFPQRVSATQIIQNKLRSTIRKIERFKKKVFFFFELRPTGWKETRVWDRFLFFANCSLGGLEVSVVVPWPRGSRFKCCRPIGWAMNE